MANPHPNATEPAGLEPRRKRALYRAWHRGTREMDLVMGRFAEREIASLPEGELVLFERLLEEPDPLVYDWITGRASPPPPFDAPLLRRIGASPPLPDSPPVAAARFE